jgi:hypothetical protein
MVHRSGGPVAVWCPSGSWTSISGPTSCRSSWQRSRARLCVARVANSLRDGPTLSSVFHFAAMVRETSPSHAAVAAPRARPCVALCVLCVLSC